MHSFPPHRQAMVSAGWCPSSTSIHTSLRGSFGWRKRSNLFLTSTLPQVCNLWGQCWCFNPSTRCPRSFVAGLRKYLPDLLYPMYFKKNSKIFVNLNNTIIFVVSPLKFYFSLQTNKIFCLL